MSLLIMVDCILKEIIPTSHLERVAQHLMDGILLKTLIDIKMEIHIMPQTITLMHTLMDKVW